jgi:hypothetical protein
MNQESTQNLLDRIFEAGLTVEFSSNNALTVSPSGCITDELRASIRAQKPALLELLKAKHTQATKRPPGLSQALLMASLELDRQQALIFHNGQSH